MMPTPLELVSFSELPDGSLITAGQESDTAGSAEEAQCRGILAAAKWGAWKHLVDVEIESDCKGAIDFLNGKANNLSWNAQNYLKEATSIFHSVVYIFCNRTGNRCAHLLASSAQMCSPDPTLYYVAPYWLQCKISYDRLLCNIEP
ncbi:hypothetical protein FRX31_026329 [Thalictrum thalictroides]|uniref:RNase H type-1 domain-containing protein n=1 Tax=Thalictrum thalictroides TaxID=46969 RepID=A0A7J6VH67_THATH|nr:hypothetical protein FRX31_026329 [Thalictrum thalictroides]